MIVFSVIDYIIPICLVLSSLSVVLCRNIVISLLMLALTFLFSALLFILLEAELIAFLIVIIYMGAIVVLFLFSIMMLEFKLSNLAIAALATSYSYYLFFILVLVLAITAILSLDTIVLHSLTFANYSSWSYKVGFPEYNHNVLLCFLLSNRLEDLQPISSYNYIKWAKFLEDLEAYGQVLYSYYVIVFVISGLILLTASIGAVHLNKRFINKKIKKN